MDTKQRKQLLALYERYYDALVQYATRESGDGELAHDLTQETFLTAAVKIDTLSSHPNPGGWLFKTLAYKLKRELSSAHHSEVELSPQLFAPFEVDGKLDYMLPASLSDSEREILVSRFEKQLDYAEISEQRGITQTACRKQLSRAIEHCRKELEKEKTMSQKYVLSGYISRRK